MEDERELVTEVLEIVAILLIVYYFYNILRSANRSIDRWVKENDVNVLSREFRLLRTGPYWLTHNRPVYKLVVQFPDGRREICWIRCNSFLGFNPDYFEVKCEEE